MKIIIPFILSIALISCTDKPQKTIELNSEIDSVSYAIGASIASNISQQLPELNMDIINSSLKENFNSSNKTLIDSASSQQIIQSYFMKKELEQKATEKESFTPVIEEGEKFLANNSKNEGVVTLPSGLQYEIIVEGKGPKPTLTDEVETHYHGTLLDGTVFDSSVDRGESISFPVTGVIKGWTEALQLMTVGSKWKLYIPYYLAYGERGSGQLIGPYSTLIFEIELINIK